MRQFFFDTAFEHYESNLITDVGGANKEELILKGSYKGKLDYTSARYGISGDKILSDNVIAILISNNFDVKIGDVIVVENSRTFRISGLDKTTLRTSISHLELYLIEKI